MPGRSRVGVVFTNQDACGGGVGGDGTGAEARMYLIEQLPPFVTAEGRHRRQLKLFGGDQVDAERSLAMACGLGRGPICGVAARGNRSEAGGHRGGHPQRFASAARAQSPQ